MYTKLSNINNKTFFKYTCSYIFIIVIMLIMELNLYKISSDSIKDEIIKSNLGMINNIKEELDANFDAIDTTSLQINSDYLLNKLSKIDKITNENILEFDNLISQISLYTLNKEFIDGYYIYLKNSNTIITSTTLYSPDVFYNTNLENYDKERYHYWINMINNVSPNVTYIDMNSFINEGFSNTSINYFKSLYTPFSNTSFGTLCIYFNQDKITDMFSSLTTLKGEIISIYDATGKNIVTLSENDSTSISILDYDFDKNNYISSKINNKKYLVTSVVSDYNKWTYVIATPEKVLLEKLTHAKTVYIIVLVIFLLLGIMLSLFLAYGNTQALIILSTPLKELFGYVPRDDITIIRDGINMLISQNDELSHNLELQKPYIKAAFLDKLLKGLFSNSEEIIANATYLDIDIAGANYYVVVLRIVNKDKIYDFDNKNIEELNMIKTLLKNILIQSTKDILIHETDYQSLTLILSNDSSMKEKDIIENIRIKTKSLNDELFDAVSVNIYSTMGNIYHDIFDIWQSFEQAIQAMSHIKKDNYELICYCDIPKNCSTYYYPIDIEQHLITFNKSKDLGQVSKLLEKIYIENFVLRKISNQMQCQLIYELKNTLIKLINEDTIKKSIHDKIYGVGESGTIEDNFKLINEICQNICNKEDTKESAPEKNSQQISEIKSYINKNYFEKDLSLQKISSVFNLSEGYFSFMFKEQTGINYTDYLEKVRIGTACDLLRTTDISITDIALNVGYNSPQSFRRAFKKIMGVSPTALRKN